MCLLLIKLQCRSSGINQSMSHDYSQITKSVKESVCVCVEKGRVKKEAVTLKNGYFTAKRETSNGKFRSGRQADTFNIKYSLPDGRLPQTIFTSQIVMFRLRYWSADLMEVGELCNSSQQHFMIRLQVEDFMCLFAGLMLVAFSVVRTANIFSYE